MNTIFGSQNVEIENPTKLKKTKADIARVKTIIKEIENQTQE